MTIISCMFPEIWIATGIIFLHFGPFFWTVFFPFTPVTTQKIKILKKWKKHQEMLSFYTSVPKNMVICYTGPEIWCVTDVIFIFHFGPLTPAPQTKQKNSILTKLKNMPGDIIMLCMFTKNYDHMMYSS